MKRINTWAIAAGLSVVMFQSCNYTDLDPTDFVSKDKAFKDVPSMKYALDGTYSLMSLESTLDIAECIADDVVMGGQAGGRGVDTYSWAFSASSGDQGDLWKSQYAVINMANRVITFGKELTPQDDAQKVQQNDYLGNAYFIRAYAHFELLRFYSDFSDDSKPGIPYVTYPHVLGQPARDKVGDCYDYIMKDLERAYNLISADKPTAPAYASKTAVNALRARVCLYHKKDLQAYVYAQEALRNAPLATIDEYAGIWGDKSNAGVILKLPRFAGQARIGSLFGGQDNSLVYGPSKSYMASYVANDVRKSLFFGKGPDREGTIVDVVKKYYGQAANIGLVDEKLLRSDEVKLIEIEALVRLDRLDEANVTLNAFRAMRIRGWAAQTYATKDLLIEQVLLERRRELAFEGHRYFDLRRYHKDIVRDDAKQVLFADHFRQIQPIPTAEIEANENIAKDQNPGY